MREVDPWGLGGRIYSPDVTDGMTRAQKWQFEVARLVAFLWRLCKRGASHA